MTNHSSLRNALFGLLTAALVAAPVLASAAPVASPQQPAGSWTATPFLALDLPTSSGLDIGPRIGGEAMYGFGEIAPKLHLDIGPRIAWAYNGGGISFWVMDFLATGRFSYAASPQLAFYGDIGMGIAYAHGSSGGNSNSSTMFDLLIAPGIIYALSPTMNFVGEVGFYINAKEGFGTHVAIPTIGLQFKL